MCGSIIKTFDNLCVQEDPEEIEDGSGEEQAAGDDDGDLDTEGAYAPSESDHGHDSELSDNDLISDDKGTFSKQRPNESD